MISKVFLRQTGRVVAYENGLKIGNIVGINSLTSKSLSDVGGFQIDEKDVFVPDESFLKSIDKVLFNHVHECPAMQSFGLFQKGILIDLTTVGYLNVNDQRAGGVWGRVNDPSDILGSCLLENGKIVPKSFEKNPTHILYSKQDGLITLTDYLHRKLLAELVKSQQ